MDLNRFIFSEKRSDRIKRHLLFWFCMWAMTALTHAVNPFGQDEISYFRNPAFTFSESALFVFAQFPIVFVMLYFILPRFIFRKRYVWATLAILLLWFLGGVINLYLIKDVNPWVLSHILPERLLENTKRPATASFVMAVMWHMKGVWFITSIAFVIKFAKYWYIKEQNNLMLQKQNTEAQLQLLTAQVHPHFLFNTLNNIFSKTQTESPDGSRMIMGLSDMLRYILYEGQKPLVPLKQELMMITEYINLEKIRYGNKLDVHVLIPDRTDDIYIAPLLLLPFVENCFKHGTSNMLQDPWINLTVELKEATLVMKLMNGKTSLNGNIQNKRGIGINNVSQRLSLLYKDKYELEIREDEEVFVVDLRVELTRIKNKEQENTTLQSEQAKVYA